ncbi:hypothetical protein [Paenibacillus shenyangensis]|nr:hypothetical protein [Paenibacillus sp. A9]
MDRARGRLFIVIFGIPHKILVGIVPLVLGKMTMAIRNAKFSSASEASG